MLEGALPEIAERFLLDLEHLLEPDCTFELGADVLHIRGVEVVLASSNLCAAN
ncbi:MAG: hypothetical protein JWQ73_1314 [Variovorax sp.]|nr:hypothetical protein [Variovorax sp.]